MAAGGGAPVVAPLLVTVAVVVVVVLVVSSTTVSAGQDDEPPAPAAACARRPVVFAFGDSNTDTGGVAAGLGLYYPLPEGRVFFRRSTGRLCDGRLVIDYLCKCHHPLTTRPCLPLVRDAASIRAQLLITRSVSLFFSMLTAGALPLY